MSEHYDPERDDALETDCDGCKRQNVPCRYQQPPTEGVEEWLWLCKSCSLTMGMDR